MSTVPLGSPPAFSNFWSPISICPGSLIGASAVMAPDSSAAVAVISLKVEPVG